MKLHRLQITLAFAVVALSTFCSTTAHAIAIFANTIIDANPSAGNPFTTGQSVVANMTASGIGRGSGITPNAGADRYNATAWNLASMDANDYFTWTLTPSSGFEIDFSSFVYTGQRSTTGPQNFAFRSSLDNYLTNIGSPSATGTTISLSAAAYQDITSAITFRLYGWGGTNASGTYSVNDFTFNGSVNALPPPGNDSIITAPASAAFNRVIQTQTPSINVSLTKTGTDATTYSATVTPANIGLTVTADGSILAGSPQTETFSLSLVNNTNGSGSTGTKSYTVVVDNTATNSAAAGQGSADSNDSVAVSATVVADRTVSASSVDLGNVIKGAITNNAVSTLTTTGDDNNFTRVTVNGTAASDGPVTVATGSSQLFNGPTSGPNNTTTRNVSGTFLTAGPKSGSVPLSRTGEGLTGEALNPVSVSYIANVFDPSTAKFASNGGTVLNLDLGIVPRYSGLHISSESIYNVLQTAGFTAGLDFDSITGTGDTTVLYTNLANGIFSALAAGIGNAYGFNIYLDANTPTGTYNASYSLKLSDGDLYAGAGAPGSQVLTLNFTASVVPESTWTVLVVLVLGHPVMVLSRRLFAA